MIRSQETYERRQRVVVTLPSSPRLRIHLQNSRMYRLLLYSVVLLVLMNLWIFFTFGCNPPTAKNFARLLLVIHLLFSVIYMPTHLKGGPLTSHHIIR